MERNIERERYYEETDYKTKTNKHGFAWQDNVQYNHVHE